MKKTNMTLVSFIVTLVVLVILAGVTINLALDKNGIIQRAQSTSNTWANTTKNEARTYSEIDEQIKALSNVNGE